MNPPATQPSCRTRLAALMPLGLGRGGLASQYQDKRSYIQKVHYAVLVYVSLGLKLSRDEEGNKWRDIQEVHCAVSVYVSQEYRLNSSRSESRVSRGGIKTCLKRRVKIQVRNQLAAAIAHDKQVG